MYCKILKGALLKSNGGNLNSRTLHSPAVQALTLFVSTFRNRYTDLPPQTRLWPESADGFSLVLKRVHPSPAKARENPSIVSIRSPVSRENSDIDEQFQLLSLVASVALQLESTNTSLNRPLESLTKARRWEMEAVEREGKGRGTVSSGKDVDESDDDDHEYVDGDDEDGDDDDDDGGGGYERMMWERDGVGCKSMPMSLAMVASLYVSATSSLVGRKRRNGVLDLLVLLLPSVGL